MLNKYNYEHLDLLSRLQYNNNEKYFLYQDPEAMENLMKMVDDPDFMKDLKV